MVNDSRGGDAVNEGGLELPDLGCHYYGHVARRFFFPFLYPAFCFFFRLMLVDEYFFVVRFSRSEKEACIYVSLGQVCR